MINTIIGLVILLIPFFLVHRFNNKTYGFFYIFSLLIGFHMLLAVITQAFGVFSYSLILGINIILDIFIISALKLDKFSKDLKYVKIDLLLIFVAIVSFICLYSVHYNYTGEITTINGNEKVENMVYRYPYFSDEWVAISLVEYSIKSGKLPLANPFWYNSEFSNFGFTFHSFIAEIMLILDLDPLTDYTLLTIASGMLICFLVYFILRVNKVGRFSQAIASISVLYIFNGSTLPGTWNLIPFIMGIISMLLGYLFISYKNNLMIFYLAFLTLSFYPPLFVFYFVSILFYFIYSDFSKKDKKRFILGYILVCFILFFLFTLRIFLTNGYSYSDTYEQIKSRIYYSFLQKNIVFSLFGIKPTVLLEPLFYLIVVVPLPIIALSLIGLFKEIKNKAWLIYPVFVGLAYWFVYTFVSWRFIIGFERNVIVTAIFLTILSGFGLDYLIFFLKRYSFIEKNRVIEIALFFIILFFFFSSFYYTKSNNWEKLGVYYFPFDLAARTEAPANNYLTADDLILFKNINGKNFISNVWKGLVIGIATKNYPLHTKGSMLSNKVTDFYDFDEKDCKSKWEISKEIGIDYIYSNSFDCPGFELVGISKEELYLYKVIK